jgi:hypothetical protein
LKVRAETLHQSDFSSGPRMLARKNSTGVIISMADMEGLGKLDMNFLMEEVLKIIL